jgi:hypothetical protein
MFAPSANMVLPRLRVEFQVKKVMTTVFFTSTRLIVLNSLPQGQSFIQDSCISETVLAGNQGETEISMSSFRGDFSVHMDNSRCTMAEWQSLNLTVEGLDALNTHRARQI